VRAVNLGVPAWIDATGTIRARGDSDAMSVMLATPALNDMSPTLYTKVGDIPLLLGLFVYASSAWLMARRRRVAESI
jgi:apolipoprotein N-acyltransferase